MIYDKIIKGERIYLRNIDIIDCTDMYLEWLNDQEVNRYLETRWEVQSLDTIKEFVNSIINSNHSYLFAIIELQSDRHIGNIKIGPINSRYSYADISYFIGNKSLWGKGYATEAISLITTFGFEVLKLHRVQAGIISGNESSSKALEKVGFIKEGVCREKFYSNDLCADHIIYGKIRSDNNIR